ncbi:MAG: amidohydrolase family protein [Alphaproteobacteria bacterium]|nr:amidohydrolase family protein [Alphaproteobacteria bacterium]
MTAETPRLKAPPGTTDTHMHIYAPPGAYPIAAAAVGPKPEGDVAAYREIQARLGLARTVVVQPTHYGADNRCTLDAIARLPEARGVAVVEPDIDDAEFERLTEGGIRGVRFQMVPGGMTAWAETDRLAASLARRRSAGRRHAVGCASGLGARGGPAPQGPGRQPGHPLRLRLTGARP